MNNEIIKNIIGINQADVEAALKDSRPAHEAGVTHVIDVLATEAGYASGKAMINDLNIWSDTVAEITQMLIDDLEEQNA